MNSVQHIIVVTMIRNEEDVIESSIRYWFSFADEIIVYDHYSTDGTKQILKALKREYYDRLIFYKPDLNIGIEYIQKAITDAMIKMAAIQYNTMLI